MRRTLGEVVPGPLLETKLHVPRRRRGVIARPQLQERLQRASESTLTLVSAPAGFGKTTLLADWVAAMPADGPLVAWLSLDQRDNDPTVFWAYVVAALRAAGDDVAALSLLRPPEQPTQAGLATLLNDLSALSNEVLLVLDDYHVIEAIDVQEGMAFLLDHLPPQVHLVIAGRADPTLPLARLRARGELVELRASDLRFSSDEAAVYLSGMGLALTAPDVAALEGRTEGWIAALQLAALSMQGRDDVGAFIAGFAGDDRYIVDYLAEEVLQRQTGQVRSFLLQTSILSRLSGQLCDAVTGQDGGRSMLEALERGNLFLVPLDDQRRWYRYHHLFADVLQAHLRDERPGEVSDLHRRACEWYEEHGERPEAIRHAMAGGHVERAADLVELASPATRQERQEATLRAWLEALPDELIRMRPVLSNGYAGSRLVRSEVEGVEERLQDVERWLERDSVGARPPEMVVVDEVAFRALPAGVEVHRAGLARLLGDVDGTVRHAQRALDLVGADDHAGRGAASALLGLACWTKGDLDAAYRWYSDGMAILERAGFMSDVVGSAITRADIRIAQGQLREAMRIYERGLRVATAESGTVLRGAADVHVGMSELLRERNDLDEARKHLEASRELGESLGLPQNPYRWRVARARMQQAEGDLDAAVKLLDEAERVYVGDYSPDVRPVSASRARVWTAQGEWGRALAWARERGLSVDDDLSYLHEFEHVTLARTLLARDAEVGSGRPGGETIGLLERLLEAAELGGRTGSVIEILVVLSLARQRRREASALVTLERALALAEPEDYVRIFVDEGPPMAALLKTAAKQGISTTFVRRLLAPADLTPVGARVPQGLIEPLSERELDVLRLLATELGGPDIARELIVSLNTVRTHTKSIYTKLGVNSRRAAVRRAQELDLLAREHNRRI